MNAAKNLVESVLNSNNTVILTANNENEYEEGEEDEEKEKEHENNDEEEIETENVKNDQETLTTISINKKLAKRSTEIMKQKRHSNKSFYPVVVCIMNFFVCLFEVKFKLRF